MITSSVQGVTGEEENGRIKRTAHAANSKYFLDNCFISIIKFVTIF
jgi:hypothetical protein